MDKRSKRTLAKGQTEFQQYLEKFKVHKKTPDVKVLYHGKNLSGQPEKQIGIKKKF